MIPVLEKKLEKAKFPSTRTAIQTQLATLREEN